MKVVSIILAILSVASTAPLPQPSELLKSTASSLTTLVQPTAQNCATCEPCGNHCGSQTSAGQGTNTKVVASVTTREVSTSGQCLPQLNATGKCALKVICCPLAVGAVAAAAVVGYAVAVILCPCACCLGEEHELDDPVGRKS